MSGRIPAAAALLLVGSLDAAQLTRQWRSVRSAHFEIVSRYEPARIRPLVETLEWARAVLDLNFGWRAASPRPALILLPDDPFEFDRMVRSRHAAGFFLKVPWRDLIVVRELPGARETLLHEYVHLLANAQGARFPAWMNEGLAEFFGSMRATGDRIEAGAKEDLAKFVWVPVSHMISLRSATELPTGDAALRFYAQAWLFANMVRLAPAYREGYRRFHALLHEGAATEDALQHVYGKTAIQFDEDARQWARQRPIPVEMLKAPPPHAVAIEESVLDDVQVEIALATVAASSDSGQARAQNYGRLSKLAGAGCANQAALGDLAFAANLPAQAAAHYREAISCGAAPAELAQRIGDAIGQGGSSGVEQMRPLAELTGSGRFHFHAGSGLFLERDYEGALREFEQASGLNQYDRFRLTRMSALALSALGRHKDAEDMAERLLREMAVEPHQKNSALLTRDEVRHARRAAETPRDPSQVRDAILRLYTRIEGTLIRVDCLGDPARFWVRSGSETRKLAIADPAEVVTGPVPGAPLEFGCGVQSRAVVIGYQPAPDAALGVEGRIRYIEFR